MTPQPSGEFLAWLLPPLAVAGFALFFAAVLTMVAWLGGWKTLAEAYPGRARTEGETWRFRSLQFGWFGHYKNCVTLGGDREGFHLSMPWFFRAGHAPIFVPWADMRAARQRSLLGLHPQVGLEFARCPGLCLWLSASLLRDIQDTVKALGGPEAGAA